MERREYIEIIGNQSHNVFGGYSLAYIQELRKIIGSRPIILTGVNIIVFNERNEILLQRRTDTGDWGLIGGILELGESLEEAAHRELFEEAGLRTDDLKHITILSGADMYYRYPNGDEIYNVISVYETRSSIGEPRVNDDEGLEVKYFPMDKPIPEINGMTKKILFKSGYINWE